MIRFIGATTLPDDTPLTCQQLIQAAILDRTYDSESIRDAAAARMRSATVGESFATPAVDGVFAIDAYKGVRNGEVIEGELVEADFADGEPLEGGTSRRVGNGLPLGSTVVYQKTGVDV